MLAKSKLAKSKLSDRTIRGLSHEDTRYKVVEPGRAGLGIRVAPSSSTRKCWYSLYRGKKNGKSVRVG